jgi:antitoxin VapB
VGLRIISNARGRGMLDVAPSLFGRIATEMYQRYISIVVAKVFKIAKVFRNGRSQAVRIPKEFRFETDEVLVERDGEKLILTPRKMRPWKTWKEYFSRRKGFSVDFPDAIEDTPIKPMKPW